LAQEPDEASMQAAARETAHDLIQGYLGPDHKVINMQACYSAMVQALKAARKQGHADLEGGGEDSGL